MDWSALMALAIVGRTVAGRHHRRFGPASPATGERRPRLCLWASLGAAKEIHAPVWVPARPESRLLAPTPSTRVLAAAALIAAVLVVGVLALGSRGGPTPSMRAFRTPRSSSRATSCRWPAPDRQDQGIDLTPDGQADVRMKITDASYRPAAPRHPGHRPPGLAVRRRQPLRRPAAARRPTTSNDPRRRRHRPDRHDDRRRPRPALRHLRPQDAQGAQRRHPRLRHLLRRQGRAGQRGLGVPQPLAGGLQPAVQGARLRHARAAALHRRVLAAGGRPRRRATPTSPGLVDHLATTTGAIGRQKQALLDRDRRPARLHAPRRTPPSSTCAPRSTTSSRWSTSPSPWPRSCARSWPSCARWPATRARRCATSRALVRSPGPSNDLIELTKSSVPLRNAAVGPDQAQRQAARRRLPGLDQGARSAAPELATARPYAPDLTGWFDDFSHSGIYDALGGASRAAPTSTSSRPSTACSSRCSSRCSRATRFKDAHVAEPALALPGLDRARRDAQADRRLPLRRVPRCRSGREARAAHPRSPWPPSASPGSR